MHLDDYDKKILTELIKDPRQSDNKISKLTNVPVKTVNRKRKILEAKNIVKYMAYVDYSEAGTGDFKSTEMYLVKFKYGIYRKQFLEACAQMPLTTKDTKHIAFKWLGEKDGQLLLILVIESRQPEDILEIFNVEIVNRLRRYLGPDSIDETTTIPITTNLSLLHNYMPDLNMKGPNIDKKYPDEQLFVSD